MNQGYTRNSTIKTAGKIDHPEDPMQSTSVVYSVFHRKTRQDTVIEENLDPDNNSTKRLECLRNLRAVLLLERIFLHDEHYPGVLAFDQRAPLSTATPPVVTRPPQSAGVRHSPTMHASSATAYKEWRSDFQHDEDAQMYSIWPKIKTLLCCGKGEEERLGLLL